MNAFKPRIHRWEGRCWVCVSEFFLRNVGWGDTPLQAYQRWLETWPVARARMEASIIANNALFRRVTHG